jgi:hypothetical protein
MSKESTTLHTVPGADKTVQLDTPIVRGEQTIAEIRLRKPQSGELRGVALSALIQMDVDALVKVLPRISSPTLTEADVQALDPADLFQMAGEVAAFLLQKRLLQPFQDV